MTMRKTYILALLASFGAAAGSASAQATVHVEPTSFQGARPLADETEKGVVRDYIESWQSLSAALNGNRADLLDADFVGSAKDKLTETIQEQARLGIWTHYQDRSHDVQIVFYSPEGLSIELTDTVDYDVQLIDHGKAQGEAQHVHTKYIVVLTPAELRWKVRIFQADAG
jgi:hypothetical protein